MSNAFEPACEVDLIPGPVTIAVRLAAVLAVVGAAVQAPGFGRALVMTLGLGWLLGLRREAVAGFERLHWTADGAVLVRRAGGERGSAELLRTQFVSPWLVVLRLRLGGRSCSFPIWSWEQPEAARRLAQRLIAGRWRQTWERRDRA